MKGFIVYDEDRKKFIDDKYYMIDEDGILKEECSGNYETWIEVVKNCNYFNYIGKTDIEGKKIYAESSVVEFDWQITLHQVEKVIGFFFWNNKRLGFSIRYEKMSNAEKELPYIPSEMSNFKIIGTLQENPELLK